jgi:hypothetical protein
MSDQLGSLPWGILFRMGEYHFAEAEGGLRAATSQRLDIKWDFASGYLLLEQSLRLPDAAQKQQFSTTKSLRFSRGPGPMGGAREQRMFER